MPHRNQECTNQYCNIDRSRVWWGHHGLISAAHDRMTDVFVSMSCTDTVIHLDAKGVATPFDEQLELSRRFVMGAIRQQYRIVE